MIMNTIYSLLEVVLVTVSVLLSVAFVTIAERKTMASMQRRLGPNAVGFYGSLQAFADALKLLLKEYVSPAQAKLILFFLGPIMTLIFALLGYLVIPYAYGLVLADYELGIFYLLAVSAIATYGILLAGWSANSKYAFLGSIRSTAQLVSYELVLSSGILVVIMLSGSLNVTDIIESQQDVWFILPLFPLFIVLFIGSVAETNRAPFDLAEAESELVSGFMTEHSAVIFVFFFLAEYASIILICIFNTILFLGGYLYHVDLSYLVYLYDYINDNFLSLFIDEDDFTDPEFKERLNNILGSSNKPFEKFYGPLAFGLKTCLMIFVFIWVRASFPRVRYDQLMSFCWTVILPLIISFMAIVPCILAGWEIIPLNIIL